MKFNMEKFLDYLDLGSDEKSSEKKTIIEALYRCAYNDGYEQAVEDCDVRFVGDCDCVSNAKVFGLDGSIRRSKFPMAVDINTLTPELTKGIKALAQSEQGAGHDNWLNGVIVQFDFKFSNKGWVEAERYHFFEFISSQSTMHRITKFNLEKTYNKHVDQRIIEIMKEKVSEYNKMCEAGKSPEDLREQYLDILYSNPAGFEITAGMSTNYRQLKTIYHQRKNHRLPEWVEFCKWIETLPHSELITGKEPA